MNRILYRQRGSFRTQRYDLLEFNVTSFSFERSKDPHFLCCLLPLSFSSVSHSSSSTCWVLFLALIIFPLAFVRIYAECCYCSIFVLPYLFRANKITVTQPELFFGIKEYFKQIFTIRKIIQILCGWSKTWSNIFITVACGNFYEYKCLTSIDVTNLLTKLYYVKYTGENILSMPRDLNLTW